VAFSYPFSTNSPLPCDSSPKSLSTSAAFDITSQFGITPEATATNALLFLRRSDC
jgi:hypothetical protein